MNKYRTHNCAQLREGEINKKVVLSGWIHRKRDHGNLLFIDLRDHYGVTQCVIENNNKFFPIIEKLKSESVIKVEGEVVLRSGGTENKDLETGKLRFKYNLCKFYQKQKSYHYQFLENRIILRMLD